MVALGQADGAAAGDEPAEQRQRRASTSRRHQAAEPALPEPGRSKPGAAEPSLLPDVDHRVASRSSICSGRVAVMAGPPRSSMWPRTRTARPARRSRSTPARAKARRSRDATRIGEILAPAPAEIHIDRPSALANGGNAAFDEGKAARQGLQSGHVVGGNGAVGRVGPQPAPDRPRRGLAGQQRPAAAAPGRGDTRARPSSTARASSQSDRLAVQPSRWRRRSAGPSGRAVRRCGCRPSGPPQRQGRGQRRSERSRPRRWRRPRAAALRPGRQPPGRAPVQTVRTRRPPPGLFSPDVSPEGPLPQRRPPRSAIPRREAPPAPPYAACRGWLGQTSTPSRRLSPAQERVPFGRQCGARMSLSRRYGDQAVNWIAA